MDKTVLYARLRDGPDWEGSRTGLATAADGVLSLARVPAPESGSEIAHEPPFNAKPSGVAADACGRVYVADTEGHRIVVDQPKCNVRYALPLRAELGNAPWQFQAPAGLALAGDTLYVSNRGSACVKCFLLPALELRRAVDAGLSRPTGVVVDRAGRVYVLDRDLSRILRFHADGSADGTYAPVLTGPAFFALGGDDTLYVSDSKTDAVCVFDSGGNRIGGLSLPNQAPAVLPRALAASRDQVLVADAASGKILVFDAASRDYLGSVPGFRAPVSAMAFDADENLLVKTDGGDKYVRLPAGMGYIESGTIMAGPLDAGVEGDWERVAVEAVTPPGTSVSLETFTQDADSPEPDESDWRLSPSLDCLLARDRGAAEPAVGKRRFLWLRVSLHSADGRISPTLTQVQAQTTGDSYLDQLPRIYRRDDRDTRFLERWLALFRSGIESREGEIELMPRRFDPAMAPAEQLLWLAQSLAFDPPQSLTPARLRALLARVPQLYAQRGTIAGLETLAEIYSGIRPKIIEAYHTRRVWQLEQTSLLGFDTALAAATPEGFVVPRDARTDPRYAGLHGQYYRGADFNELVRSKTDETIDFHDQEELELLIDSGAGIQRIRPFSVRWSGQIKPRFSETYDFDVEHRPVARRGQGLFAPGRIRVGVSRPGYRDGARLWIDGRLLIDDWTHASGSTSDSRTVLDAGRWHAIQLEIWSGAGKTPARLLWSSRSQRKEVVPQDCLYSVLDEHADLTAPPGVAYDVGHAVVGESGPLAASEFGSTLFTDYSHLFTVVAPAGRCCDKHRRDALRELIEAEKPAHTDYHLCFAGPHMRVGFQARLGIDAIVADGPPPLRLDETILGRNSFLADALPGGARVAARARLGQDTVVG